MKMIMIGFFCYLYSYTGSKLTFCDKQSSLNQEVCDKVDSVFDYYFQILDAFAKDRSTDRSLKRVDAIHFMESYTKINTKVSGNYFGKMDFIDSDLELWHKWYLANRKDLYWDEKNRIVRKK